MLLPVILLALMSACTHDRTAHTLYGCTNSLSILSDVQLVSPKTASPNELKFTSSIRCIFQDSKGHYWFGSQSEGVCRYDGKTFTYLKVQDGLCNNQVRSIQEDKKGNIWFGTGGGISYYDGVSVVTVTDKDAWKVPKYFDNNASAKGSVWKKEPDDLWFDAGINNGVFRYDGEQLHYLQFPVPLIDSLLIKYDEEAIPYYVFTIYEDNDDNIWFGTLDRGVVGFDGYSFAYIHENQAGLSLVRSIFQDDSGAYWFGDNGAGVYHYNPVLNDKADGRKALTNFTVKHGLGNDVFKKSNQVTDQAGTLARIWAIQQDASGAIWFGTIDAGVWKYDGETLTNYTVEDGLTCNQVEVIYEDREGQMWFGMGDGNVCRINERLAGEDEVLILFEDFL